MRADVEKAWLPATDHKAVIAVDQRIDKALDELSKLSETLRQSFGLLPPRASRGPAPPL